MKKLLIAVLLLNGCTSTPMNRCLDICDDHYNDSFNNFFKDTSNSNDLNACIKSCKDLSNKKGE